MTVAEKTETTTETKQPNYDRAIIVQPRLPMFPGIFNLPAETCIASHAPHERIEEHLHEHFYHMHIRYGFEIPPQNFDDINGAALEVAMAIKIDHRVDCNPPFVARSKGPTGVPLVLGDEVIHWVQSPEVGEKATKLFEATGRRLPEGYYFAGFRTSDVDERYVWRFTKEELQEVFGSGLRCDQHFEATWKEPRNEAIEPYDVIIYLGDDVTDYHTFFRLPVVVPIGAF